MPDEQTQGTTQSSQGTADQSTSQAAGATGDASSTASQGSTASTTASTQTAQTQQQATAPARPDWLPEQYFDATKGPKLDEFGKHYAEIATRDAAEQVRRNALPAKPEDVKIELPKEFQLPQGVDFKLDPAKPEFGKLQAAAVKHGLSQEAVTDLVGVYAETLVGSEATLVAAKNAEIGKLGANGPARVTALSTFFDGIGASELKQMLVTAPIVQAAEKLVAKFASQGVATFSQGGREPTGGGNKPSEEQWGKMSAAERMDYTNNTDQSKFKAA